MARVTSKTPFLNFFYARCRPPHPRLSPYTPPVETPTHRAPGRPAHHRQHGRPCQMQGRQRHAPAHTPGRWARCTGMHSIPDRPRRADRTCGGCWRAWSVSETEQIRTRTSRIASIHIFVTFCCLYNVFTLYKVTQV